MAEEKTQNLVSKPPLQVALIDKNGLMSRAWAVFFRDLYRRVAYKGGNSIDENIEDIDQLVAAVEANIIAIAANKEAIEINAENIAQNAIDIAANTEAIIQNALAIAQNASDIAANAAAIVLLANSLDTHINAFQAHGSNGDIVGFNDLADESIVGLVKRMASIADAVETTVDITTADIGAAPAAYDQAYTQSVTDLTNENKAAINQLASDLNDTIAVLNNLLAESKASGQMTT
ncbi:hypothetical protein NVP1184A_13 [Vibrio phage 1.184.A._10N.286.49.A5]|nr:hypothetical protein NVP1184A_13 [Vibrio phage 1.184.A._10N.286.49.A5]